jgi:hypothetical protein
VIFLTGVLSAAAAGVLLVMLNRYLKKKDATRPDFVIGFVDHGGSLVIGVSNSNGGDGKQAQCVIFDNGSHAYGVPRDDRIVAGESFDVITPFRHGVGPYGVLSAYGVSLKDQYLWRVEKNAQRRPKRRRSSWFFRNPFVGPQQLMREIHGAENLGDSVGECRFVRDRTEMPLVDR